MSLICVTARTVEPLTVAEAKRQLKMGASAGEPAPTAPTVALITPPAAGNCDNGAHRVGFTFYAADGTETEIGPLSDVVTVVDKAVNGKIAVTNVARGGTGIVGRKGYLVPVAGGAAKLAITIANNDDTACTIDVADASLGVAAPTANTTANPEIVRRISAVCDRCEGATNRATTTQTWDEFFDATPCERFIEVPKPPLQSVTHIKYRDSSGTWLTFSADSYEVIGGHTPPVLEARPARGRIVLKTGYSWPTTDGRPGCFQVRFVCGYGLASAVPALLKEAMLIDLGTLDLVRAGVVIGTISSEVAGWPGTVYKWFRSHQTQTRRVA